MSLVRVFRNGALEHRPDSDHLGAHAYTQENVPAPFKGQSWRLEQRVDASIAPPLPVGVAESEWAARVGSQGDRPPWRRNYAAAVAVPASAPEPELTEEAAEDFWRSYLAGSAPTSASADKPWKRQYAAGGA